MKKFFLLLLLVLSLATFTACDGEGSGGDAAPAGGSDAETPANIEVTM